MKHLQALVILLLLLNGTPIVCAQDVTKEQCPPLLDFKVKTLDSSDEVHLCKAYKGKVILIVNTASKCAFTGQYDALEKLYAEFKDQGLVVLGFPSNDFGGQEPGSEEQIKKAKSYQESYAKWFAEVGI